MTYSELLHELFDGGLDATQEDVLFRGLADRAEVRGEFKNTLAMMLTIRRNTPMSPPLSSTSAVFGRLGFQLPTGTAFPQAPPAIVPVAQGGIISAISGWIHKYRQALVTAPVAAIITALLLWFPWGMGDTFQLFQQGKAVQYSSQSLQGKDGQSAPPAGGGQHFADNVPVSPQLAADTIRERVVVREIIREKIRYIRQPEDYNVARAEREMFAGNLSGLESGKTVLSPAIQQPVWYEASRHHSAVMLKRYDFEPAGIFGEKAERFWDKLHFETRGIVAGAFPKSNASEGARPFVNNIAANLLYSLDKHHAIGVEFGQEAFAQRYRTTIEGVPFIVDQNPVLPWLGLAYRYTVYPDEILSPFLHIVAGGTVMGAHGRSIIGFSFSPDSRTRFIAGIEGSLLLYAQDGALFMTPKLGVSYGVSIRF